MAKVGLPSDMVSEVIPCLIRARPHDDDDGE